MVAVVRWDGDRDAILVSVTSRPTAIQLRWQRGRLADTVGHHGGTTAAHQELAGVANKRDGSLRRQHRLESMLANVVF